MLPGPHSARRAWVGDVAVAALACAAFAAAVPGELVLDDVAFLAANARLDAVSSPLVFFRTRVWDFSTVPGADVPLYRPVFMVALWAGRAALGSPAAWHLAAIALHAGCSVLVWRLARALLPGAAPVAALAAGVLFAVHPVHAEAVSWILAFVHPLATFLALVAAHAAHRHARGHGPGALASAAALAALAALTSEGALAVAPLLVALDAAVRGRLRPAVVSAHALSLAVVLGLRAAVPGAGVPLAPEAARLGTAADFLAGYLRQLVLPWPQPLHLTLPAGGVSGPLSWAIAAAAVACAAWVVRRAPTGERSVPLLAVGWIAVALVPVVAGALNPRPLFAPRALYLSSVGLAFVVAWLLRGATGPARAGWGAVAAVALVGIGASNAAALGWTRNETVYARAAAADPRSVELRVKLGELALARGDATGAEGSYRSAVSLAVAQADRATALEALGVHLATTGRLDEAERALGEAAAAAPSRSSLRVALGNVAYLRGDPAAAREHYRAAVRLDPRNFEAAANLALACEATGDAECARGARAQAAALGGAPGGGR